MVVEVERGGGLRWARELYLSSFWIRSELALLQCKIVAGNGALGILLVGLFPLCGNTRPPGTGLSLYEG